ncbi:MAG: DUF2147 domain-containing protein [Bacteroidota bacterium]
MKKYLFLILPAAVLIILTLSAQDNEGDKIIGKWFSHNNDFVTDIYKKDGKYHGKIIWLREPLKDGRPRIDENNREFGKKTRKLLNLEIISDLKYNGNGDYNAGIFYNIERGAKAKMTAELKNDKLLIHATTGFFRRNFEWKRKKN